MGLDKREQARADLWSAFSQLTMLAAAVASDPEIRKAVCTVQEIAKRAEILPGQPPIWDGQDIEDRLKQRTATAKAEGLEIAVKFLAEQVSVAFMAGADDEAKRLRTMLNDLKAKHKVLINIAAEARTKP